MIAAEVHDAKAIRHILTPEGVRLTVMLAHRGDRAAAVLIDVLVIVIAIFLGILIVFFLAGPLGGGDALLALALLAAFFGRVLYFPLFELHGGRTPGKKWVGLRVIGRNGAPLDASAILTRNLVREVELWLPLTSLFFTRPDGQPWGYLVTLGWLACVVAVPLLNRDRMRGGDLLAGTWVIREPKAILHRDLLADVAGPEPPGPAPAAAAEAQPAPQGGPQSGPSAATEAKPVTLSKSPVAAGRRAETARASAPRAADFTAAQLDSYGAKELNVLADLLLTDGVGFDAARKIATVARTIRAKIGYDGPLTDDRAFLAAYYRAARAKMETDAQWGRLKADKHDTRNRDPRAPR